jgi:hypothetical protein
VYCASYHWSRHSVHELDFDEIAEQQGWNDQTLIQILRQFITEVGMSDDLNRFAQETAAVENKYGGE